MYMCEKCCVCTELPKGKFNHKVFILKSPANNLRKQWGYFFNFNPKKAFDNFKEWKKIM